MTFCFFLYKKSFLKKYLIIFIIFFVALSSFLILDKRINNRYINETFCSMNIGFGKLLNCNVQKKYITQDETIFVKRFVLFSIAYEGHYEAALKMFLDKPLFGHGIKMFRYLCDDVKFKNKFSCTTHPHNTLLQFLVELGIVGLIFLLIAAFFFYRTFLVLMFKLKKNTENYHSVLIFLSLGFIYTFFIFLPSGQFFNNFYAIQYSYPLGFFMKYYLLYEKKNKIL